MRLWSLSHPNNGKVAACLRKIVLLAAIVKATSKGSYMSDLIPGKLSCNGLHCRAKICLFSSLGRRPASEQQ